MQETMDEIDRMDGSAPLGNKRDTLLSDISEIEGNIKTAQENLKLLRTEAPLTPITPEQANARNRAIVFLRKDLARKQTEYEELDSNV